MGDQLGRAREQYAPPFDQSVVDPVDLEGDLGADSIGENGSGGSAEDHRVLKDAVIDRECRRTLRCGQDDPAYATSLDRHSSAESCSGTSG
nr:hypothetical protein [Streptomyces roseoverticillatus]